MGLHGSMYGSGGLDFTAGADVVVTTRDPVTLEATTLGAGEFSGWEAVSWPTSGDRDFPNGTSEAAVLAGVGDTGAESTTFTPPGTGSYTFRCKRAGGQYEYKTVRVTRPLPSASWDITAGEDVSAGTDFGYTLSDTGGADLPESGAYAMTIRRYTGGVALTLTHDGSGGFTGTFPSQDATGRAFHATGTITDRYGRTSVISTAMRMAGTIADPPLIAAPAKATAALDDGDQVVTFTDSASQGLSSTSASIVYGPSGHGASLSGSSPSLARTLTGIDTPGIYGVRLTGTNSDGSGSDTAIVEITSSAPTADAGAGQQHSGGTVNLDGSGSTASGARTITGYSWAVAGNSPDSATLTGASTATPSFTAVVGETYIFVLTVTDSEGEPGTDSVTIYPTASIVTDAEDYTTDTTLETLTYPGADTLRDAAGTTDRANTYGSQILINGGISVVNEVVAGGFKHTTYNTSGSYAGADGGLEVPLPTDFAYGLTFIQVLVSGIDVSQIASNALAAALSSTRQGRGNDTGDGDGIAYRMQVLNDAGTVIVRGQEGNGGSIANAAKQGGSDGLSATEDWWFGFRLGPGGYTCACYAEQGRTTFYDQVPATGSGVYRQNQQIAEMTGQGVANEFDNGAYFMLEGFDYSANLGVTGTISKFRVSSVNLGGD